MTKNPRDDLLDQIEIDALEASEDPTFVFDDDLYIVYANAASGRFNRDNGGHPDDPTLRVGASLRRVLPDSLRDFYENLFTRARSSGKTVVHDYDCSSPTRYRLYRMEVMPLRGGFLVGHSLRVEHAHDRTPAPPLEAVYRTEHDLILQCSHCRRTRRARQERWDWVPKLLDAGRPKRVSNALCPACYAFHYRPDAP